MKNVKNGNDLIRSCINVIVPHIKHIYLQQVLRTQNGKSSFKIFIEK